MDIWRSCSRQRGKNVLDRAKQSVLLECLNYGSQENTDSKVTEISTVVEEII